MAPAPKKPAKTNGGRPNSLGLSARALQEVLDELDGPAGAQNNPKRDFVRRQFRLESVHIKFRQPNGQPSLTKVACRNVSQGGMSIIHNSYMHPGTDLAVVLPHRIEGPTVIQGRVVRCNHRRGALHEIGIRFGSPINVRDYVTLDPFDDTFSLERVEASELEGVMLHAEPSELDRRIVQHYLTGSMLRIRPAETYERALEIARESVDVILVDFGLPGPAGEPGGGARLITDLRNEGNRTPTILIGNDASAETKQAMLEARANAYLIKPAEQARMLRAIGEFLVARKADRATATTTDVPEALRKEFAGELKQLAPDLRDAMQRDDLDACRKLALRVQGSAPSFGFPNLADLARTAAESLTSSMSISESADPLRTLANACERPFAA